MGRYELWAHCAQCARWYYCAAAEDPAALARTSECPVCRIDPDRSEVRQDLAAAAVSR